MRSTSTPQQPASPRRRHRASLTIAAAVLGPLLAVSPGAAAPPVAPAPVAADPGGSSGPGRTLDLGVQFHGLWSSYSDRGRERVLDKMVEMGATSVRLDVSWAMIQPQRGPIDPDGWGVRFVDRVVGMASERGLDVLATFWLTPPWAGGSSGERSMPADVRDYGRALAWAAERWEGQVSAWEVWNEPNSRDFLADGDPARYTRLLCAAHAAVRDSSAAGAVDVVYGGTMHNDLDWIEGTYDAGAGGCFDVMATHPYQSPSDTGPDIGGGDDEWEFEHIAELGALMRREGDTRPVWVTEVGWSTHANTGDEDPWERGVTRQDQARFTVDALERLRTRHTFVDRVFLYNERAKKGASPHQRGYGILRRGLRPRPVYGAVQDWSQRTR